MYILALWYAIKNVNLQVIFLIVDLKQNSLITRLHTIIFKEGMKGSITIRIIILCHH